MIGLVAVDGTVRPLADELHAAWPDSSSVYRASRGNCMGPPEALEFALGRSAQVVCFAPLATIVSLLGGWGIDIPRGKGLLCVDPQRRYVIPLTGRDSGAEELALEVAAVLGVTPVLTGRPLRPEGAPTGHPSGDGHTAPQGTRTADAPTDAPILRIVDQEDPGDGDLVVLPRKLVVGIGAGSGTEQAEVMRLLMATLKESGLDRSSVGRLATVAGKADHPAVRWARFCLGRVPVDEHPADVLAGVPVPNPSAAVGAAVGTASVAEAAALASAPGGELVVTKRKSATATVAIARAAMRGRLALVGLGPGEHDLLVPRALTELRRVSAVVGPAPAVEAIAGLLRPGTRRIVTDDCAEAAATLAAHGHAVALVALGDGSALGVPPGPYDVVRIPGLPGPPIESQGDPA
ncbi:cobalamin biosynthesis protein [Kitasatospora aureofaciens]|uniref:cobalamin biosynthesis protein n=1 Tax=Kitasatospora aureofaciens TaxID=1894 RepID=UPI001C45E3CE|nr:cobalamin biosynthesis protein [Kitasatospora aureofaciens]MBV6699654.1 cobalamin biosynthesis protein [Kitasatospora aureofaciens]